MKRIAGALALTLLSLVAARQALAQDAATLFREGNDLAREGLYAGAVTRYRSAAAAGLDTSLLHYNLGVAEYRLGLLTAAVADFERASADPALAGLATYNRGLAERSLGQTAAARRSFEEVIASTPRADLRALASRALAESQPSTARAESPVTRPPAGDLTLIVSARYGQDDNVYRTPSQPYVDLAQPGEPLVTPRVQSAPYLPLDVLARYRLGSESGDTDFLFGYRLDGNFYSGEFTNANEIRQQLTIGADVRLPAAAGRRRLLDSEFFVGRNEETNFDPDDGLDRTIGGFDLSQRFSYRAAGMRAGYEQAIADWSWGLDARLERRAYDRVPLVASYDHDLLFARAWLRYRFNERMSFSFGGRAYRRSYDERRSRGLDGLLLSANPLLELRYRGVELGIERRLAAALTLGFDYQRLDRGDEFVGYDDYARDVFRLRADYRPSARLTLGAEALAGAYDYPRALAFNTPAGGPRSLDRVDARLWLEYRLRRKLWLWAQAELADLGSSDARAEYRRSRANLGVTWRR